METTVDARGLTCPGPVLLVKEAVEETNGQEIIVLIDNAASRENVVRFLESKGYSISDSQEGGIYRVAARCDAEVSVRQKEEPADDRSGISKQKILVLITTDCLGSGDDLLGGKLMVSYLKTIKEMATDLWQLIFVNSGVKLTTMSSPVLKELQEYEQSGVIILACGTCLEHYRLSAEKAVGGTTNMLDIVTATQLADKVVTIS